MWSEELKRLMKSLICESMSKWLIHCMRICQISHISSFHWKIMNQLSIPQLRKCLMSQVTFKTFGRDHLNIWNFSGLTLNFFSTLDMCSGYYQIEIDEEDRRKTALITKYGSSHCKQMPFGLCIVPATFWHAMTFVFRVLIWKQVLASLIIIIILRTSFENCMNNVTTVF